jgi:hypothetical protein
MSGGGFRKRAEEQLRLILGEVSGVTERLMALDLTFPRVVDSLHVAQEIVHRAARFRLEHTNVSDTDVDALQALTGAERLVPEAKCFAMYTMPSYRSARPDRQWTTTSTSGVG